MERRLTVEDVYLLTDPRCKSMTLDIGDYESAVYELRSQTPKPKKGGGKEVWFGKSRIPGIRTHSTTPRGAKGGIRKTE